MANILLTGGHAATTGIAVIEGIKERFPNLDIYWIGSKNVVSGTNATSMEYKIYPSLGVKYFSITAGKLQTKFTRYTIPLLLKIPIGFIQSLFLLLKIRPKLTVSFGGFSSFPVVFWSWLLGIPVVLHEQTVVAGRASIISRPFVSKIALSRISSQTYFPGNKEKISITGNPLSKSILSVKSIDTHNKPPTILVMGGSRGSEFINEEIIKIIPDIISKYKIVHITGERDFEKYLEISKREIKNKNYQIISFVLPQEMGSYYQMSDIVIARSGANTVSEIMYVKRPTIFIPLPRTFLSEQVKNAECAKEFGIAQVMLETEVNPRSLKSAIEKTLLDFNTIVKNVREKQSPDAQATNKLLEIISPYIS